MQSGATTSPHTAEEPLSLLEIRLFGPLDARCHGAPLPNLRTRKGQWLLALLVLRAEREVERDWLAGLLWPESPESQTRANLRRSLTDLRQALGPEAARLHSPSARTLRLALEGAAVDVLAFDAAMARGDEASLKEAVGLYRGPLLEGCAEEWVIPERQAREQAYLAALETLASQALERGDLSAAETEARRAMTTDPLRESAHRVLMQALAARGEYGQAVQVYRDLRLRLHQELNAEPDAETTALFQQLRAEARGKAAQGSGLTAQGQAVRSREPCTVIPEPPFPSGTLTFLFTDIEGSTRLWDQQPDAMRQLLAHHDALLRQIIEAHGGCVFKTVGDQFCAAFATAPEALTAALAAQQALQTEPWLLPSPGRGGAGGGVEVGPPRVRMALHTGAAEERDEDYFGPALNRVARLLEVGHGGQILLSEVTQGLVRDDLPAGASLKDRGTHRLRDLQRPEQVFELVHPELPGDFPPLRSLDALPHNLPQQLTSFIGRDKEMVEVRQRLTSTRLLALTGTGGAGKTRLSLQVAAEVLEEYPDGVWLVELAPLSDPAFVPQAVATVLSVREEPGVPLTQTLVQHLKPKRLLLLLDNCEHLLAACAPLADTLLRQCPQVTILATSREGLGIAGETVYRVPSLSLPDPHRLPQGGAELLPSLTQYEAVRLFIDRAVAVQPGFVVTNSNALAVAEVCHRLDGIPLAIELAAARVRVLPVEQIAGKLHDRFRLLTGGSRTALPRQQTLRALIDWSYDLLSEPEQALLRRLSVFAGGWTLEAAEAVGAGEEVEAWEVLDLLTALVDKSLVLYEEQSGEARYHLLETVRQYAQDRLLETAEGEEVRRRHLVFFLRLAEEAEPKLQGAEQAEWLDRLEREQDNLRTALGWSEAQMDGGRVSLRLAAALSGFWACRGPLQEGQTWLERALARTEPLGRTVTRAKALHGAGVLAWYQSDSAAARPLYEKSVAIYRESGDRGHLASVLSALAWAAEGVGDLQAARSAGEESVSLFRELGAQPDLVSALNCLTWVAMKQGDYARARALSAESLATARETGDKLRLSWALSMVGDVARRQGDLTTARAHYEESLALQREVGHQVSLAKKLNDLGWVALSQDDGGAAHYFFVEGLAIWRALEHTGGLAECLEGLARMAGARRQWEQAATLIGAVEALREAIGASSPPAGNTDYPTEDIDSARHVTAARIALGEEAFAAAWAEGHEMSLEQAISYALEKAGSP